MKIKVDVCGPVVAEMSADDIVVAVIEASADIGGARGVSEIIAIITRIPDGFIQHNLSAETRGRIAKLLKKEAARYSGVKSK